MPLKKKVTDLTFGALSVEVFPHGYPPSLAFLNLAIGY